MIQENPKVNFTSTYDQRYVFGLRYIDDLILRDDGGTRHYCLSDYFSITAIVNTSGTVLERYTYDAFGAPTYLTGAWGARGSSSYSWETLYASYRYDLVSGMYQVRNRYLHPNLGRWISRDPLGEIGFEITRDSPFDPEGDGPNLYAYVMNNVVNHVDFSGLVCGAGDGWGDTIVPDKIPGVFDFRVCCQAHDDCYRDRRKTKSRRECDSEFNQCVEDKACKSAKCPALCNLFGNIYWGAIRVGGGPAYGIAPPTRSRPTGGPPFRNGRVNRP